MYGPGRALAMPAPRAPLAPAPDRIDVSAVCAWHCATEAERAAVAAFVGVRVPVTLRDLQPITRDAIGAAARARVLDVRDDIRAGLACL